MDVDALLAWYDAGHRDLPWRRTADPWAILVSEVMLQQTQAARVIPYYERFLARFPTPQAAAGAAPAAILEAWSGLGYNRRALALQRAGRHVAEHGWPDDLRELPGVGPYTAAAVASFAFGVQAAAVDTNVRRVLDRHAARTHTARELAGRADELLPRGRAAAFNQAMMELGATVCTPRRPACPQCPVAHGCGAHAAGGPAAPVRRGSAPGARFEDTDRWLRGRVVAALLAGEALPRAERTRMRRVLAGLQRDGLIVRTTAGTVELPPQDG
jgi:A/G-specific adenine glycosylase